MIEFVCTTLQTGKLSTGDSLDMSPHDEAAITSNDATIKDMEVGFISFYPRYSIIIYPYSHMKYIDLIPLISYTSFVVIFYINYSYIPTNLTSK